MSFLNALIRQSLQPAIRPAGDNFPLATTGANTTPLTMKAHQATTQSGETHPPAQPVEAVMSSQHQQILAQTVPSETALPSHQHSAQPADESTHISAKNPPAASQQQPGLSIEQNEAFSSDRSPLPQHSPATPEQQLPGKSVNRPPHNSEQTAQPASDRQPPHTFVSTPQVAHRQITEQGITITEAEQPLPSSAQTLVIDEDFLAVPAGTPTVDSAAWTQAADRLEQPAVEPLPAPLSDQVSQTVPVSQLMSTAPPIPTVAESSAKTAEPPQVRIGHINVLIEEQPANKSREAKSASTAQRSNPFGLRGL